MQVDPEIDPLALRPSGRARTTDAAKVLKASLKESAKAAKRSAKVAEKVAATKATQGLICRKVRAQLLSLLKDNELEVLDLMAILLFEMGGTSWSKYRIESWTPWLTQLEQRAAIWCASRIAYRLSLYH